MRICLINNLYGAAARGGAERIVELEAEALAARGHAVSVVSAVRPVDLPGAVCSPDGCGPAATDPRAGRVTHRPFVAPNLFPYSELGRHGLMARFIWHLRDMFNFAAARRLGRLLDELRPDVVHTHNLMGVGFLTPALLRRRKIRHVHTVHDVQLLHPSGLMSPAAAAHPSPAARIYERLMAALMGSPAVVFYPSDFLCSLHQTACFFPDSRKTVLRNPAAPASDISRPVPAARKLLFVGQLEPHKGIGTVLAAWRQAAPPDAFLSVIGNGSLAATLRAAAADLPAVRFLGRLSSAEVAREMADAYGLLFSSEIVENSPTVILEAFSSGLPTIATAVGGVPELVRDGRNGLLFPPGDAVVLAMKIRELTDLPASAWEGMSAAARESSRLHDPARHIEVLEEAYRSA